MNEYDEELERELMGFIHRANFELEKSLQPILNQLARIRSLRAEICYLTTADRWEPYVPPIVDIPTDILVAARRAEQYFAERNVKKWAIGGVCSRD